MGIDVERRLYEGIAVTTALNGAEMWSMGELENRLNVIKIVSEEYVWSNTYGTSQE